MTGFALTRATTPDGRWDYTLYSRPNDVPFIHALDTVALRAVCIDLPSLANADLNNPALSLGPGGSVLRVEDNGITQAMVDTATYVVTPAAKPLSAPPIRPSATHADQSTGGGDGSVPWAVLALVLIAGAAFTLAALGARRRAGTGSPQ